MAKIEIYWMEMNITDDNNVDFVYSVELPMAGTPFAYYEFNFSKFKHDAETETECMSATERRCDLSAPPPLCAQPAHCVSAAFAHTHTILHILPERWTSAQKNDNNNSR